MKVSNAIYRATRKHKVSANLVSAIFMQESSYRINAKGCVTGLVSVSGSYGTKFQETKVCSDFGISMINYKTARKMKIDIRRLTVDLEYAVESGVLVLVAFQKRFGHREMDWWTRYNCGNKGTTNRTTCITYRKLVERYLMH